VPSRVDLHHAAVDELLQAATHYADVAPDVSEAFAREVQRALDTVAASPLRWPFERAPARRYLLKRFPFKLIYVVEKDRCLVLAIAHVKKRPGYWNDRT